MLHGEQHLLPLQVLSGKPLSCWVAWYNLSSTIVMRESRFYNSRYLQHELHGMFTGCKCFSAPKAKGSSVAIRTHTHGKDYTNIVRSRCLSMRICTTYLHCGYSCIHLSAMHSGPVNDGPDHPRRTVHAGSAHPHRHSPLQAWRDARPFFCFIFTPTVFAPNPHLQNRTPSPLPNLP